MKRGGVVVLSVAVFFAFSGFCKANVNEIVVTATRNHTEMLSTPSMVNVITASQLKRDGIIYVKDALKMIAGINVVSNGAFGGQTTVNMRGLPGYYTKILIDGVDVSDPSEPQPYYNLADLTVNDISRIEIVQGAQSGLYGSNAIGGVINIITKRGSGKPGAAVSFEAGSHKTYMENASAYGKSGRFSAFLSVSRFDTGGISKMDKYDPDKHSYSRGDEKDSYHKTDASTRLEYEFSKSLKAGWLLKLYKTQNYLDNGWYITPDFKFLPDDSAKSNNTPEARSLRSNDHFAMTKLYIDKHFGAFKLKVDGFFVQNLRYYKSAPPSWLDYKGKRWGFDVVGTYTFGNTRITGGFTHKIEKYEDTSPFKKLRYNYAGFVELQQLIGDLKLQAVARQDRYKTFGRHFTYKLGASYMIPKTDTVLKANYSTGFRAPSIWELYAPANPSWYFLGGNEDLKPEKAKTWDFGVYQRFFNNRVSLRIRYFASIVKDRIAYWTDPSTWQSTYKNIKGKTHARGVELSLQIRPVRFAKVGLSYTYTKSKNPDTGKQIARLPKSQVNGYVTLIGLNGRLSATVDGRYIGTRFDDSAHTHQTGKYAVFDFTALYKLNSKFEVSLTVKNIFDRFYEEVYGYSTLGRSVFASVNYRF